jgi:acyl-CoA thioester hydrolase
MRVEAAEMLEQALQLPRSSELIVPTDYIDGNGHMNMMYYTLVGNIGSRHFWEELGLSNQLRRTEGKRSTFMLRQLLTYLNELQEGEEVAVHVGLHEFDAKKMHYFVYIISLTNHTLACMDERLEISIDMTTRRSTSFEPEVLEKLEHMRARHAAVGWKPRPVLQLSSSRSQ